MHNTSVAQMRDERLCREVRSRQRRYSGESLAESVVRVLASPLAKGFYVEPMTAVEMDRRHRAGESCGRGLRGKMWLDFFDAMERLLAVRPDMSRVEAVATVIATATAPGGFYLSLDTAMKIVDYYCRRQRRRKGVRA